MRKSPARNSCSRGLRSSRGRTHVMARPVTICQAVTTKQSGPTIPRRRLTSLGGSPLGRHCRPSLLNRRIALSSSLGVHADHRIGGVLMGSGLLADVPGTARPGRRAASHRPGVALQDESLRPQQVTHGVSPHPMTLASQLSSQPTGRLGRPSQRRHRVAALSRLHRSPQRGRSPGIRVSRARTAAWPADPAGRLSPGVQLIGSQRRRGLADPGGPGHQADPAMPQFHGPEKLRVICQ
jgi:hypothetical protein